MLSRHRMQVEKQPTALFGSEVCRVSVVYPEISTRPTFGDRSGETRHGSV